MIQMIQMQIRAQGAHVLDVVIDERELALQLVQLVDAGVVRDADAVETVDLVVGGDGFGRGGDVRVLDEAFAFGDEGGPGGLGERRGLAGECGILEPDLEWEWIPRWCCISPLVRVI
ncbi:hypothetical protein PMIN04_007569 [Paraphaeosphaeria minitans]